MVRGRRRRAGARGLRRRSTPGPPRSKTRPSRSTPTCGWRWRSDCRRYYGWLPRGCWSTTGGRAAPVSDGRRWTHRVGCWPLWWPPCPSPGELGARRCSASWPTYRGGRPAGGSRSACCGRCCSSPRPRPAPRTRRLAGAPRDRAGDRCRGGVRRHHRGLRAPASGRRGGPAARQDRVPGRRARRLSLAGPGPTAPHGRSRTGRGRLAPYLGVGAALIFALGVLASFMSIRDEWSRSGCSSGRC